METPACRLWPEKHSSALIRVPSAPVWVVEEGSAHEAEARLEDGSAARHVEVTGHHRDLPASAHSILCTHFAHSVMCETSTTERYTTLQRRLLECALSWGGSSSEKESAPTASRQARRGWWRRNSHCRSCRSWMTPSECAACPRPVRQDSFNIVLSANCRSMDNTCNI